MILVGSTYFFNGIEGFVSKDVDNVELVDNPNDFKNYWQMNSKGKCLFRWRRMSADEFVKITLQYGLPMSIGKFLVPEFNKEINFTIEHLKQLQPLVDKLDDRHLYEKIIYDAYIENNDFNLSEEQLKNAYNTYKLHRNL